MTYFVAVMMMCFGPMATECRYAVRPVITISENDCKEELARQIGFANKRNIFATGSCFPVTIDGETT